MNLLHWFANNMDKSKKEFEYTVVTCNSNKENKMNKVDNAGT